MAYVIGDNYEDKFCNTIIEFSEGDDALQAFFKATPANPLTINDADWRSGTWIAPEVVPTKVRITEGDAIYDWRTVRGGAILVSGRFRDCVEELDPGRHQFFPISVEDRSGAFKPGPFFLFNVVGHIDSIVEARSNFTTLGRGVSEAWIYQRDVGPWKCAMDISIIGARACWTELHYGRRGFISDRLAALFRQRGLIGFDLDDHCDEVSV